MRFFVLQLNGERLEIDIPGDFDYEKLSNEVRNRVHIPADALFLFHNQSLLTRFSKIDSSEPIEVTLIDLTETPNRSFPRGDWMFLCDLGRFPPNSLRHRYPTSSKPERPPVRPGLREIIPNIGYEYGNPFSSRPTLHLPRRRDHTFETHMMNRDRTGVTEDELERGRRDALETEEDVEAFRLGLPRVQQAAIERLSALGFDIGLVTRAFYDLGCNETLVARFLTNLRHHIE